MTAADERPQPEEEMRFENRLETGARQRIEISDGWWPLLTRLDDRLAAINPAYRLRQIRQADGRLHIDAAQDTPACEAAFQATLRWAEAEAAQTCEVCGHPGLMRELATGSATLCAEHCSRPTTDSAGTSEPNPWPAIVGECYTRESIARTLGITPREVDAAAAKLDLLALSTSDGVTLFPAMQVRKVRLPEGLGYVLRILRAGVDSPLMWAQWLRQRPPSRLQGLPRRRIDMLHSGYLEELLVDAQHTATAWAVDPDTTTREVSAILAELGLPLPEKSATDRLRRAIEGARDALLNLAAGSLEQRDVAFCASHAWHLESVLGELLAALAEFEPASDALPTQASED